ncbi:diaminopimelate epimerase [Algisphaera agarilytica]|uniref:Diaminopimelate epimerase n=1 Tax=Algisphaera agarilytica TaxID=1385975 RepID=A0A7X0H8A4_9BACT|nr:diaminopimelate epimerase [Algisphaera agarilytica]MBB6431096.1 diaminopimelate epimerase [Algisphaera agarilytica]
MRFTKMHGLGNDYVYVDGFSNTIDDPAALAVKIADRHFGVGGDGLILAMPAEDGVEADARMRMFNADGSESEMCGNGIRCVCKLVHDHGLGPNPTANPMRIQTGNGVLSLEYTLDGEGQVETVAVDMGAPILDLPAIPVDESKLDARLDNAVFVSMGNPHVVIYIDDDSDLVQPDLGAELERHPAFPNRINVHFVRVKSPEEVEVYHWERGSGATLACGTGACAVCVAGVLSGRTGRTLTAHLPGGPLKLHWEGDEGSKDGQVIMTGPAVEVFTGEWPDNG